jgi:hypothetical protein
MRLAFIFLAGCTYISHPYVDAGDPLTVEVVNQSDGDLYFALKDGALLDAALSYSLKNGEPVQTALSCADVACAAGCDVERCQPVAAVRELSAGEALLVDWNGLRYDEGELSCPGASSPCRVGSRATGGRYLVTVCFGRAIQKAALAPMQRSADDAKVVLNAAITDETCAPAVEVGFPSYDVRYKVEVR